MMKNNNERNVQKIEEIINLPFQDELSQNDYTHLCTILKGSSNEFSKKNPNPPSPTDTPTDAPSGT